MNTPICDFVKKYCKASPLRLHMPGHKGKTILGPEAMDITEIPGADSLFHADGIIEESENNAGSLFGCYSFYSTEGSSLSIRAMLYLCTLYAHSKGTAPIIAAGRNAHKVFLNSAALMDFNIHWIYGEHSPTYLSCEITPKSLETYLSTTPALPTAVYITCPDYLGNIVDIRGLSEVCKQHDVLLIVDNAHGAYLKFLSPSLHPMDLGADICCDSAHKTFPVLTGGGYLHISHHAPDIFRDHAKQALSMFASTSPSYLILESLDAANAYLEQSYALHLKQFTDRLQFYKKQLSDHGYHFYGNEPLKWTLNCKPSGYYGNELAQHLSEHNIICEFSDPDYVVLMFTPEIDDAQLEHLVAVLKTVPPRPPIDDENTPRPYRCPPAMTPRQAAFCKSESVSIDESEGRILADPSVGCPPAVPILVCGERIDHNAIAAFRYYGISHCRVCCEAD